MEWSLRTEGLVRRFGARTAVDNLDLHVGVGEVYGFLGPNGAGKTTAIRCMLGLLRRDAGHVWILGDSDSVHQRTEVGAMVETPAFHEALTAKDNLRYAAAYAGRGTLKDIEWALGRVGLGERGHERVRTYSLGMRQRLGIARALVSRPKLLMLDEPTNGLDPRGMKEIRELLCDLARVDGITVFVSSHLLSEVEQMCTRVGILEKGRLVVEGPVAELLAKLSAVSEVELTTTDRDVLTRALPSIAGAALVSSEANRHRIRLDGITSSALNRSLVAAGVAVDALVPMQASLEDLFLQLTTKEIT